MPYRQQTKTILSREDQFLNRYSYTIQYTCLQAIRALKLERAFCIYRIVCAAYLYNTAVAKLDMQSLLYYDYDYYEHFCMMILPVKLM